MSDALEAVELWNTFRRGDRQAFGCLSSLFYQPLFNYGTKLCEDQELVEDCIQDLFLDLWRRREYIGHTDHVKFYLLKSLRRKIFLEKRTREKWISAHGDLENSLEFVGDFSVEAKIISSETDSFRLKKLQQILELLSKRQREVIYLKFYQELDYEQISTMMSITYQSARNLVHTAIRDLQNAWFSNKV